jgi:SAM-dependent methyltransferase
MLSKSAIHSILQAYPHLNTFEKYHLGKRLGWCPYDEISELLPHEGTHLDIGCGHGHFLVYLTQTRPKLALIGCDPDGRKISVAKTSARDGRIVLTDVPCENFDCMPDTLTSISLLDVLYLMPRDVQHRLLVWASKRLAKGGVLVIKAIDIEQGLRSRLAAWQEFVMVTAQRTLSSGAWAAGQPLAHYVAELQALGFEVRSHRLCYTRTPALLICARKVQRVAISSHIVLPVL